MYAPYPRYFKFKRKYQQYSPCFQTIFPFLMTMIRFTSEIKRKNSISFIKVRRNFNKFMISVYCKLTFKGAFNNFENFIPMVCKHNLLLTLLHREFKFFSNFELFHQEIDKLKAILNNNGYRKSFINICIKKYFNKDFIKKEVVPKAS